MAQVLLMSDSYERAGTLGFRCVRDIAGQLPVRWKSDDDAPPETGPVAGNSTKTPPSGGNTVLDVAIATPTLSTFVAAVKASGLATTLSRDDKGTRAYCPDPPQTWCPKMLNTRGVSSFND